MHVVDLGGLQGALSLGRVRERQKDGSQHRVLNEQVTAVDNGLSPSGDLRETVEHVWESGEELGYLYSCQPPSIISEAAPEDRASWPAAPMAERWGSGREVERTKDTGGYCLILPGSEGKDVPDRWNGPARVC